MSQGSDPNPGRPQIEQSPSAAPSGRPGPPDADPATEVEALAALLAEVVELAGNSAVFPSRWAQVAELALEHDSVRAALRAEQTESAPLDADSPLSGIEHIIAELNSLHGLVGNSHGRR